MQTVSPGKSLFLSKILDGFQQYMLVVQPDERIGSTMLEERQACSDRYGNAVTGTPYITIADFIAKEAMEETLLRWMQRIYRTQQRFRVTLEDYSGFPPQSIYVRVQDPLSLSALAQPLKVIDPYISSADCPPVRVAAMPYLLLAKLSSPEHYFPAMKAYAMKTFRASFMVDEVVLLKRNLYQEAYSRVHIFRFLS